MSSSYRQACSKALLMAGCVLQEQGGGRLRRKGKYRRGSGLYTPGDQSFSSQAQASQSQASQQEAEFQADDDAAGDGAEPAGGAGGAGGGTVGGTGGEALGIPEEVARKLGRTDGPFGRPSSTAAAAGMFPIWPCLLSNVWLQLAVHSK